MLWWYPFPEIVTCASVTGWPPATTVPAIPGCVGFFVGFGVGAFVGAVVDPAPGGGAGSASAPDAPPPLVPDASPFAPSDGDGSGEPGLEDGGSSDRPVGWSSAAGSGVPHAAHARSRAAATARRTQSPPEQLIVIVVKLVSSTFTVRSVHRTDALSARAPTR